MAKRDYYEILGVGRDVAPEALKKAYKAKALQYHPDRNPDNPQAEERFKECSEAFEVLSNPEKRAAYDRFGHAGVNGGGGAGGFDFGGGGDFSDLFEGFFGDIFGGGGRRRRGAARGNDLQYRLTIDFTEAVFGAEKGIEIPRRERCDACQGSGAKPGTRPVSCPQCGGSGQTRLQQGFFSISRTCPHCRGIGQIVKEPCASCRGRWLTERQKTLVAKIPPGVDTGVRLKLEGEGEIALGGGLAGDLYVLIQVRDHPLFQREGQDILCELPIRFTQAALGAEIDVPTLDGPVKMTLPPGTQNGRLFRLRGKGVPRLGGGPRGDQHVRVQVEVPARLTRPQRELLEALAQTFDADSHPEHKSFFDKVRNLFGNGG